MASDKAVRGKYLYLAVAQAMAVMRSNPTRLDVEDRIEDIIEANPGLEIPSDEVFTRPGMLLGRISTMAHNIIYNFELRDHRERKAEAAQGTSRIH